jgi:hypothetical protein
MAQSDKTFSQASQSISSAAENSSADNKRRRRSHFRVRLHSPSPTYSWPSQLNSTRKVSFGGWSVYTGVFGRVETWDDLSHFSHFFVSCGGVM